MPDVKECKKCGSEYVGRTCESCRRDRELIPAGRRKRQPADPTIYIPDFNGIGDYENF